MLTLICALIQPAAIMQCPNASQAAAAVGLHKLQCQLFLIHTTGHEHASGVTPRHSVLNAEWAVDL